MIINGIQFETEILDILTELKIQLSANGVHRFEKIIDSGDDIMTCCPYHADGQERKPSFGIRKRDAKAHCFACGKVVNIDEMIANCFGYNDPAWGFRWLLQNFATVQVEERKEIELDFSRDRNDGVRDTVLLRDFASDEELDGYRYTHPYLYERGLTDEIIALFDIGYDKAKDEITFPVRYWGCINFGKTLLIARRSVKTKRFDLPKGIEKPLYGLYEIWEYITRLRLCENYLPEIWVCEGLFDCLRLWCNGYFAVAGFGCLFSEYQLKLLEGLPTRKLILALDNDKAGKDGMEKIRKHVKNKLITEVVLPQGRKDIGECTDEEIQNLREVWI